ncbi:hypothetical protein KUA24_95 [Vibrio phage HNL01]|nr:hypothetical protein KUA24_95 [Vibrio phage HNL01]
MTVTNLEAGKTYLIKDEEGFFGRFDSNLRRFNEVGYTHEGKKLVDVEEVGSTGVGYSKRVLIFGTDELKYLEEYPSKNRRGSKGGTLSEVIGKLQHMSNVEIAIMIVDNGWEI